MTFTNSENKITRKSTRRSTTNHKTMTLNPNRNKMIASKHRSKNEKTTVKTNTIGDNNDMKTDSLAAAAAHLRTDADAVKEARAQTKVDQSTEVVPFYLLQASTATSTKIPNVFDTIGLA